MIKYRIHFLYLRLLTSRLIFTIVATFQTYLLGVNSSSLFTVMFEINDYLLLQCHLGKDERTGKGACSEGMRQALIQVKKIYIKFSGDIF